MTLPLSVPLIVLSRGLDRDPEWQRMQAELLQLSPDSQQLIATKSGQDDHGDDQDDQTPRDRSPLYGSGVESHEIVHSEGFPIDKPEHFPGPPDQYRSLFEH